ncbi:flippase [Patescibacteria group bacterium]|nr:flippase [Patescibacteria group bacterium]
MINKISQNTLVQLIGKIISTIIGLIVVALMTRALGAAGFGSYTTIVTFLQFFGILVDLGLTMTLARELGKQTIPADKLLSNLLSLRTILSGFIFALAPLVAWLLPYPKEIVVGIALTSLAFFLSSLSQNFTAVFQYHLKSQRLILAELSGRLILLLGTLGCFLTKQPLNYYLLILILSNTASAGAILWQAYKLSPFYWQIDKKIWHYLWQVTWPVALTIALNLIYFKTDTIILSLFRPLEEVGLYGAAYKVLEVLLAVPAIIGGLVLPLAARYKQQAQPDNLQKLFSGTFDSLLAGGLAVIIGSLILGEKIMVALAGPNFAVAGQILVILSLATALIFLGNALGYFIFALDKQKKMFLLYGLAALGALTSYLIFIPQNGIWAAAWITVAVEAIMTLGSLIMLYRWGLKPTLYRWPKIILASLLLAVGLSLPLVWWLNILIGGLIYLVALWKLKLIPKEELFSNN